jgi:hypothetical protein
MAKETKKSEQESTPAIDIPAQVQEALNSAAKMLGVAVTELWTIFVRQYVVRGISEVFFGVVIFLTAWSLRSHIGLWWLLASAPSHIFFYGAIQQLGNPKYFAIGDILGKVKSFNKDNSGRKKIEMVSDHHYRW